MAENSNDKTSSTKEHTDSSGKARQRQKIRVKYKQRVKIKTRPKGYKLTRFWEKNKKNLVSYVVLLALVIATIVTVSQVIKQSIEKKQHESRQRFNW